jgi:hypothetical protein
MLLMVVSHAPTFNLKCGILFNWPHAWLYSCRYITVPVTQGVSTGLGQHQQLNKGPGEWVGTKSVQDNLTHVQLQKPVGSHLSGLTS